MKGARRDRPAAATCTHVEMESAEELCGEDEDLNATTQRLLRGQKRTGLCCMYGLGDGEGGMGTERGRESVHVVL